jgi:hypothetical protein
MSKEGTWRASARPIIAEVLQKMKDRPEGEIRKALKAAYPWGERKYHPYKIWCDEIRVQRGYKRMGVKLAAKNPDQQKLF